MFLQEWIQHHIIFGITKDISFAIRRDSTKFYSLLINGEYYMKMKAYSQNAA